MALCIRTMQVYYKLINSNVYLSLNPVIIGPDMFCHFSKLSNSSKFTKRYPLLYIFQFTFGSWSHPWHLSSYN